MDLLLTAGALLPSLAPPLRSPLLPPYTHRHRLSDQELADNLLVLLLAGHDTSSATLTLALANLQARPAALDKLRQEQAAVLAKHGPGFTAGVLKEMVYADAVIRWGGGGGGGGEEKQGRGAAGTPGG